MEKPKDVDPEAVVQGMVEAYNRIQGMLGPGKGAEALQITTLTTIATQLGIIADILQRIEADLRDRPR